MWLVRENALIIDHIEVKNRTLPSSQQNVQLYQFFLVENNKMILY